MRYLAISAVIIAIFHFGTCIEEEPGLELGAKNDTMVEPVPTEMPEMKKKCGCGMKETMTSMSDLIKVLVDDVRSLKEQITDRCPAFDGSSTLQNETDLSSTMDKVDESLNSMNETDVQDEEDNESISTPKPPLRCEEPFKKINESCFSFFNDPSEWKSWGDASAYCQKLDSRLASPGNPQELREYLQENYSNVFWVGARKTEDDPVFEWLGGKEITKEEWKDGQPTKTAAKFCIFLEFFSGYRAVNHYCGEKFPFICQHEG